MSTVTLDSPEHAAKADEISLLIGLVGGAWVWAGFGNGWDRGSFFVDCFIYFDLISRAEKSRNFMIHYDVSSISSPSSLSLHSPFLSSLLYSSLRLPIIVRVAS